MKHIITLLFIISACGADSFAKACLQACPILYYFMVVCGAIAIIRLYISICKEL